MDKRPSFNNFFEAYKLWVCNNPSIVTDVENVATWSSYFIAGKINKSPAVSELVFAASKLLSLYNDRLIYKAYGNLASPTSSPKEKLKLWLTIIHYSEVFIELLCRRKWDTRGKWTVAAVLQSIKAISALILLYKYKEMPVSHPAIPPLQRKNFIQIRSLDKKFDSHFTLTKSGRVIRRVEGSTPIHLRDWQPITVEITPNIESKDLIVAETLHIMKPLIHLASIGCFGSQSWKQWLLSMAIDVASVRMYSNQMATLTTEQKLEVSRRKLCLLLYLLRSPMYNRYSESAIERILKSTARAIPPLSFLCNPVIQYLHHWQDIYFYMWTS